MIQVTLQYLPPKVILDSDFHSAGSSFRSHHRMQTCVEVLSEQARNVGGHRSHLDTSITTTTVHKRPTSHTPLNAGAHHSTSPDGSTVAALCITIAPSTRRITTQRQHTVHHVDHMVTVCKHVDWHSHEENKSNVWVVRHLNSCLQCYCLIALAKTATCQRSSRCHCACRACGSSVHHQVLMVPTAWQIQCRCLDFPTTSTRT